MSTDPNPSPPFGLGFSAYDRRLVRDAAGPFGRNYVIGASCLGVVGATAAQRGVTIAFWGPVVLVAALGLLLGVVLVIRNRRFLDERAPLDAAVLEMLAGDFHRRGLLEAEAAARRGCREASRRARDERSIDSSRRQEAS